MVCEVSTNAPLGNQPVFCGGGEQAGERDFHRPRHGNGKLAVAFLVHGANAAHPLISDGDHLAVPFPGLQVIGGQFGDGGIVHFARAFGRNF